MIVRLWTCAVYGRRYETGVDVTRCPCHRDNSLCRRSGDVDVPATDEYAVGPNNTTVITARSTLAVLSMLRARPDGVCRRDFAMHDIYEPSARMGELRAAGFVIDRRPCRRHNHRTGIVEYRLGGFPE